MVSDARVQVIDMGPLWGPASKNKTKTKKQQDSETQNI